MPLAALGTAMLLARFADIMIDPIVGTLTDRWRPRMGRRRVWLLIGVPTLLLISDGTLLASQVGALPAAVLGEWVEQHAPAAG